MGQGYYKSLKGCGKNLFQSYSGNYTNLYKAVSKTGDCRILGNTKECVAISAASKYSGLSFVHNSKLSNICLQKGTLFNSFISTDSSFYSLLSKTGLAKKLSMDLPRLVSH